MPKSGACSAAAQQRPRAGCDDCPTKPCALRALLNHEERAFLASRPDHVAVRRGHHLVQEGASTGGMMILTSGVAAVHQGLHDGRRQIYAFKFPGDVLCVPRAGTPARIDVHAVTRAELCQIGRCDLRGLQNTFPRLADVLLELACEEMARAAHHMLILGRLNAGERIATFLLDMAGRAADRVRDGVGFALPMNREDIADHLGLNIETVSRNLTRLRRAGLIALPRPGHAVLLQAGALAAMTPLHGERSAPSKPGAAVAADVGAAP